MKKLNTNSLYKSLIKSLTLLSCGLGFTLLTSMPSFAVNNAEQKVIDACNAGDISSCNELANHYLSLQKFKEASDYLTKICYSQSKDAEKTCAALTTLLLEPSYNINNIKRGIEISEYLCERNNTYGCVMLSVVYTSGDYVQQDITKAKFYAQKACDLKDHTGCNQLGLITYTLAYTNQDINLAQEAFSHYKKACDLGYQPACDEYAQYDEKMQQFKLFTDSVQQEQVQNQSQANKPQ